MYFSYLFCASVDVVRCVCRYKAEEQRFDLKHKRKLEELRAKGDATIKELEQLHNEKRESVDHSGLYSRFLGITADNNASLGRDICFHIAIVFVKRTC